MKKEIVIYYPYPGKTNKFHANMIKTLENKYKVISLERFLINPLLFFKTKKIYINNVENRKWGILWKAVFKYLKMSKMEVNYFFHNYMQYEAKDKEAAVDKVKYMVDWADYVYILSSGGKEILKQHYSLADESKIKYIDHINYIEAYPSSKRNYRKELNIPEDAFVFGFFGKVRPYKNIELIIEAFNRLSNKEAYLILAGGPMDEAYGAQIAEMASTNSRIRLSLQTVPDEDLSSLFRDIDILVLPYDTKANMNSGVMVAAFSYGKTVLISDTEMAKDFDKQGFIYMYESKGNDLEELVVQMNAVMAAGKEEIILKGKQAYQYVLKNNSQENVLHELGL